MAGKKWSKCWRKSRKPAKQRAYARNAPLHIKSKLACSHLSKELREKYKVRSVRLRQGDTVKVMRGQFRGKAGKIERIDIKKSRAYITGIEMIKKDGSKAMYPINTTKLLVNELELGDRKRLKRVRK